MTLITVILAHYKERESNLKRIVDDLLLGSVIPDEIIVFIDNQDILFDDSRVTIIRSDKSFMPISRFAIGQMRKSDCCLFIDDDISVKRKTIENFINHHAKFRESILGIEGSVLGNTDSPYTDDTPIRNATVPTEVDVIIRLYFVPTYLMSSALGLRNAFMELPDKSLDDVYLSLGNKYLNEEKNIVIPFDVDSGIVELSEHGVGQSYQPEHYKNRNLVCKKIRDVYETLLY